MSNLSASWKTEAIGDVCDIHDSRRIPLSSEQRRDRKGPYPYYGANNIQDSIDNFIFDFDAVLLAEDGGYYDEYETRDIAQYATGKYWVNNHAHILTGRDSLDTKFLYYALVRKNISPWINTGTRAKLNQSDLRQIEIPVPPLPEQKKIAEILSGIDVTIRATESKLQKLIAIRSNASEDLLAKTNAEATKMPLGDCIELVRGYAFKSEDYREKGGTRILRVTNITEQGKIDLANNCVHISEDLTDHYNRFQVRENDLLLVMVGATTGKLGVVSKAEVPSLLNQNIWCLRTSSPSGIIQEYLHYSMPKVVSRHLEKQQGSARDFLTQKEFFKEEIEIPNLAIQRKIVQVMGQIDKCIDATRVFRERLLFLKSALSADLLSGRKRVSI